MSDSMVEFGHSLEDLLVSEKAPDRTYATYGLVVAQAESLT